MKSEDEFKEIKEQIESDRNEIGTVILDKLLTLFKIELNEYISSLKCNESNARIFKSVSMCDFVVTNLFLNIVYNTAKNFDIKLSSIVNFDLLKENLDSFDKD